MNRLLLASCAAALPLPLFAQDQPDYSKMKTEEVFQQLCSGCHGKDMSGGQGGSLIDGEWKHGSSDDDLLKSIREGNGGIGHEAGFHGGAR